MAFVLTILVESSPHRVTGAIIRCNPSKILMKSEVQYIRVSGNIALMLPILKASPSCKPGRHLWPNLNVPPFLYLKSDRVVLNNEKAPPDWRGTLCPLYILIL
jgi:hypothetical protein